MGSMETVGRAQLLAVSAERSKNSGASDGRR